MDGLCVCVLFRALGYTHTTYTHVYTRRVEFSVVGLVGVEEWPLLPPLAPPFYTPPPPSSSLSLARQPFGCAVAGIDRVMGQGRGVSLFEQLMGILGEPAGRRNQTANTISPHNTPHAVERLSSVSRITAAVRFGSLHSCCTRNDLCIIIFVIIFITLIIVVITLNLCRDIFRFSRRIFL